MKVWSTAQHLITINYSKMSSDSILNLFVMRHGEREDHINHSWRETTDRPYDSPLSKLGEKQALHSATNIPYQFDVILCSPFHRTCQTATPIAKKLNKNLNIEYGIAEHCVRTDDNHFFETPPFEIEDLAQKFDLIDTNYSSIVDKVKYIFPESVESLHSRYEAFIEGLKQRYTNGENILIVTHGATVRNLPPKLDATSTIPEQNKGTHGCGNYCSLTKIELTKEGNWKTHIYADLTHLADLS